VDSNIVTYSGTAISNLKNSIPQIIAFSVSDMIMNQGSTAAWNDV